MVGETKKKLIIVVDDKTAKYGELLSALVNSNDDKLDDSDNTQIIGVKDGTVQTVIWTDKVFRDNQAQVSSDNRIILLENQMFLRMSQQMFIQRTPFQNMVFIMVILAIRLLFMQKKRC